MIPPLKILSLLLVLLLAGAAFARNVQFYFVKFAQLRSNPSFQARVEEIAWWDPKDTNSIAYRVPKGEMHTGKPELWVKVTQTDGTLLELIWEDATTQHLAFARSLQVSNTYRFPEVWDEFVTPKNKK